jgi:hypothetical protein
VRRAVANFRNKPCIACFPLPRKFSKATNLAAPPAAIPKESAMTKELIRHNRPVSDHLHPLVYKAMAGLALWFALSAWVFFGDTSYTALALAVVSLFLFITVAIPFAIWLAWRGSSASGAPADSQSFREWASGEFETWQCRVSGGEAAVEILLPLMAVAFGLFVFGLVLHLDVPVPG